MENEPLKFDFEYSESKELIFKKISNDDVKSNSTDFIIKEIDDIESIPDGFEDIDIYHDPTNSFARTWESKVLSISNWPEFKTKTCYKWVRIPFNGRTKVPYPCMWRRTCRKAWYLRIVYSGTVELPDNIEKIIKDCSKIALIPALPILLTGNVGGAVSAFLGSFKPCLITKGIKEATKFSISFVTRKKCGEWKRV